MVFERAILVVSAAATLAFLAAGAHAWAAPPDDDLRLHVLLALGSAMLLVFPHLWVVVYLAGTARAVRREAAAGRAGDGAVQEAGAHLRRVLPPLALASVAALATVAAGQGVIQGLVPPWAHVGAFAATLALQAWALAVAGRRLTANARLLARLDAGAGA